MNVLLLIKFSSTEIQGKRKLCVCHTKFLLTRLSTERIDFLINKTIIFLLKSYHFGDIMH